MKLFKTKKAMINAIIVAVALLAVILCAILVKPNPNYSEGGYYATFVALIPPVIAIVLALITKEVYSSLFVGIVAGAAFYSKFNIIDTIDMVIEGGIIASVADAGSIGILVFLVLLGTVVALMNKAGGAYAFGAWAKKHVKTKVGAQLATFALGVLIFVDDYFNCLTVGSVMSPVTDSKKISREKLAYLIDATAAPICMIAPISSWAAAVSETASEIGVNGLELFIKAIPYNFYSLLTIVMVVAISLLRIDFGPMKKYEEAAQMMDSIEVEDVKEEASLCSDENKQKSRVYDLVIPIAVLIVSCVIGMLYNGGFFTPSSDYYLDLINAFGDCSASIALSWGSMIALIIIMIYFVARKLLTFKECMESIPQGFKAMVPAILILIFAWTLNTITGSLGADVYVHDVMENAKGLYSFLPAIIFLVAIGLSFSTGTSWGTFGILIPIVVNVFGAGGGELLTIGISACLAGAVCGDHCSPISDTTIMASAGAKANHLNHVSTQLPYALTVAAVSFVTFIIAGFVQMWFVVLPIGIALMIGTLYVIKYLEEKKGTPAPEAVEAAPEVEA